MADSSVSFEGMDALIGKIESVGKMKEAQQIVRDSTINVARRSQELVPVGFGQRYPVKSKAPKGYRGGTLKRSMTTNISGNRGEVKYGAEYAAYQEYGTRYQTARKFLGKPFQSEKMNFINRLKRLGQ